MNFAPRPQNGKSAARVRIQNPGSKTLNRSILWMDLTINGSIDLCCVSINVRSIYAVYRSMFDRFMLDYRSIVYFLIAELMCSIFAHLTPHTLGPPTSNFQLPTYDFLLKRLFPTFKLTFSKSIFSKMTFSKLIFSKTTFSKMS